MAKKYAFKNLPRPLQAVVVLLGVVEVVLHGVAARDLRRRPDAEVRGSRRVWRAALFINIVGPIAYLKYGRVR